MDEVAALRALGDGLSRLFYAESRDEGETRYRLTPTQKKCLLGLLHQPGCTDVQLANRCGIVRSQLSRSVKGLMAMELVRFLPSPAHKAQRHLFLSEEGRLEAETIAGNRDSRIVALLETIDQSELRAIQSLSSKLRARPADAIPDSAIKLRSATYGDLVWLLRESAARADRAKNFRASYLSEQITELAAFLDQSPEERAWTAHGYGAPLGGCALLLTDDVEGHLLNGQIILLHLVAQEHAAQVAEQIIRTCVEEAEALTLVHLRIELRNPQTFLKEALSRLGFQVRRRELEADRSGWRREVWTRHLTPLEEA
ncbi:MAG: MarR family winged helix-turn-helix transcriptional regulator [Sphingomonadales bacterium]|nr:MarR family winged helix-turn-helix transcriptional regulator [Sphingomonadales bacterium]